MTLLTTFLSSTLWIAAVQEADPESTSPVQESEASDVGQAEAGNPDEMAEQDPATEPADDGAESPAGHVHSETCPHGCGDAESGSLFLRSWNERMQDYRERMAAGEHTRTGPLGAVACLVEGSVKARMLEPLIGAEEFSQEIRNRFAELTPVQKHDVFQAGALIQVGRGSRLVLHLGREVDLDLDAGAKVFLHELHETDGFQYTHVRIVFGNVQVAGAESERRQIVHGDEELIPINKRISTSGKTAAASGTEFEMGWSPFDGSYIRDVDTSPMRQIVLDYFNHDLPILVGTHDASSSRHPAPAMHALFRTVYPPPSPAFSTQEQDNDGQVEHGFLVFRDDYSVIYQPPCNRCMEPPTNGGPGPKPPKPPKKTDTRSGLPKGKLN